MPRHHVLLIIFPAQGHINPAFQFAKRLTTLGARVTLSTTLHMHNRIANNQPLPTLPGLSLLPFSDGYNDGFKPTGDDSSYSLYNSELKRRGSAFVTDLILSNAKQGHPFTCLVYSHLLAWAAEVAREYHLPMALLWVQPATVLDILYYYFHGYSDSMKNPSRDSNIEIPGLSSLLLAPRDLPSFLLDSSNPVLNSLIRSLYQQQFDVLDVETNPRILANSFEALEPEALRAVDKLNMIAIGPLIPSAFLDGKDLNDTSFGGDIFQPSNACVQWLDSMPLTSVVYVSFGSFCVLSKTQTEEIARALLDSGRPFLWVIREKENKGEVGEEEELRWREELEKKGKIVKWCSQVEVLSHPSLGCFLTHCGWNSTVESLVAGVPIVAFPQWLDQMTNAKLIEDVWKTGVRVDHRVNEDGIVGGEEIRKCLEVVMGNGEKGEELRNNAKRWKGLAREAVEESGSSEKNLRAFLDDVEQECMHLGEK